MKRWIPLVAFSLGILCWLAFGHPLGWGQSSSPDLTNGLPQEHQQQTPPDISVTPPLLDTSPDPSPELPLSEEFAPQIDQSLDQSLDPPDPLDAESTPRLGQPGIVINRLGNLHYAPIKLDGYSLFKIAAEVPPSGPRDPDETLPIQLRVERIQNRLQQVVSQVIRANIDPSQLQITTAILNNEVVLILVYEERRPVLLTITQDDADLAGTAIEYLASEWEQILSAGLRRAWEERQPRYLQEQLQWSALTLVGTIAFSVVLILAQKRVKSLWENVLQAEDTIITSDPISPYQSVAERIRDNIANLSQLAEQRVLGQRQDLLFLLRRLLTIGQTILWVAGLTFILIRFPQTRALSLNVLGLPFFLVVLILVTNLLSRMLKLLVSYYYRRWFEERINNNNNNNPLRLSARARTYAFVSRDFVNYIAFLIFILGVLYIVEVPIRSVLTGAGVLGLFLSLTTQGWIKNLMAGAIVLLEDQYALDDWVTINDSICGVVEHIDLVCTKIRGLNGSVVSIANGEIQKVENMTVDWARVTFRVDVAYQTDIDKAIRILRLESVALSKEDEWSQVILNPVELIGVERLAHDGMRLLLWIQTQAGWQWAVERELRLRLRKTFEQEGIPIGIPQQEIPQLGSSATDKSYLDRRSY